MSFEIGGSDMLNAYGMSSNVQNSGQIKAEKLKSQLTNVSGKNDDELLQVCKDFESYMLEQVFKSMKKTVPTSDLDDNEYMQYFGDNIYQEYAKDMSDKGGVGLAQTLYESMKRNYGDIGE